MANNFTAQDVLGMLRVLPFFSLVFLVPGYLIGLASNAFKFRSRGISERVLLSLVLSCAASPYIINILCRSIGVRGTSIFYCLLGAAFFVSVLVEYRRTGHPAPIAFHWTTKVALCLAGLWIAVCLISLPDLQIGNRLYSTAATYDHSVRTALIASALRVGAPPANPFFYPGHPVAARYYYYWNVLCALPAYLTGANVRVVLYASCVWSGLLLASIIPLYLKYFLEIRSDLRLTSIFGFMLIAITGLDILPTLAYLIPRHATPMLDMEWWDPVQVTSWIDSFLWVPHHVASLVACFAAFLFLGEAVRVEERSAQTWLLLLGAIGFASAAGLSIYVMLTFGIFVVVWVLYLLIEKKVSAAFLYLIAGFGAILLSAPFIHDLLGQGSSTGAGGTSFLMLSLRPLPNHFHLLALRLGFHNRLATLGFRILLGIVVLILELGIYFLIGVLQVKQDWRRIRQLSDAQRSLWLMVACSLTIMIFVRSTVIGTNDLGHRSAMVLQFVLLLWAAIYLANKYAAAAGKKGINGTGNRRLLNFAIASFIAIGGISSIYQLCMLRAYLVLSDQCHWKNDFMRATGSEQSLVRSAYAQLDRIAPLDAIVQYNPASDLRLQMLIYSRYQQVDASYPDCNVAFGGSLALCQKAQERLMQFYDLDSGSRLSQVDVDKACAALHINVLVVTARDPVWGDATSWMSHAVPIIQNRFVRMYQCSDTL